ncbi:hypothetical protein OSH08_09020 [Kaistia geumhonensis]|uniref:Uncharacterized protein n=1 Tax=Kaistia geumhonensis TaxID=410839 RepID=A0ABU0M3W1_9HYPH|nr:hypothetical protein [Kaistia geumhonensis]MCX5479143.1 hypothetical protein [Kaistia geumhonensis]MDQ0515637.1 hypothetical protein [Kaistia geumhonensis]
MSSRIESTRALLSSSQLFGFSAGARSTIARRGIDKGGLSETLLDETQILETLNTVQTAEAELPASEERPASTEAA